MAGEKSNMIACKSCGAEIAKTAKVCPHCGAKNKKPIYKRAWFIILIAIVVVGVIVAAAGGDDEGGSSSSQNSSGKKAAEEKKIEYTAVTVDELCTALDENAANAADKYKNQYVEVEGKLGTIDSDGSYFELMPMNDEWAFQGVTCRIKSDKQLEIIKGKKSDDILKVKGKITEVGEIMSYSLNIDSIE